MVSFSLGSAVVLALGLVGHATAQDKVGPTTRHNPHRGHLMRLLSYEYVKCPGAPSPLKGAIIATTEPVVDYCGLGVDIWFGDVPKGRPAGTSTVVGVVRMLSGYPYWNIQVDDDLRKRMGVKFDDEPQVVWKLR